MTPRELAAELGVPPTRLRRWLRTSFARPAAERYAPYQLTPALEAAARTAFAQPHVSAVGQTPYHDMWFWEGRIQDALAKHLKGAGWEVIALADTASNARGFDIAATSGQRTLRVEVKGFPPKDYADVRRSDEHKRTNPNNQAVHWYSQALLKSLRTLQAHPADEAAMAFPDHDRYRSLIRETERPLRTLRLGVYLITELGSVEALLPHARRNRAMSRG